MTVHLTQLLDDAGQGLALDELHGVMMHAAVAADGVDRDDVGVVQQRRGLGLDLESLELLGVGHGGEGQYLQRHAAVEGQLHGLVDDAHAAAADRAEQLVVPQGAEARTGFARGGRAAGVIGGRGAAQVGQLFEGGEQPTEVVGALGVMAGQGVGVNRITSLNSVG